MSKKQSKKGTAKEAPKAKAKADSEKELTEDQLERVAGGAVDSFLSFDPIKGEVAGADIKVTAAVKFTTSPGTPLFKR